MNFPNEMSGTHPLAGWCNKLLRAAKASRVSNGLGYKTRVTSDGTILEVGQGGGGAAGATATVTMYRIISFQADYLTCRAWNGVSLGSVDVIISKPFKLRNSIVSALVDGVTITYTYDAGTLIRSAVATGFNTETHVIVPRYNVNDLIFAMQSTNGTNTSTNYLDINVDGRAWSRAAS